MSLAADTREMDFSRFVLDRGEGTSPTVDEGWDPSPLHPALCGGRFDVVKI